MSRCFLEIFAKLFQAFKAVLRDGATTTHINSIKADLRRFQRRDSIVRNAIAIGQTQKAQRRDVRKDGDAIIGDKRAPTEINVIQTRHTTDVFHGAVGKILTVTEIQMRDTAVNQIGQGRIREQGAV